MVKHRSPVFAMRRALIQLSLLLPFLLSCLAALAQAAPQRVVYPRPESARDARTDYPVLLLQLALQRAGGRYRLVPSAVPMQQGRALRELEVGHEVDVVWSMTSVEREARLLPIRIPIYKGLIGWRIALVRAADRDRFADVRTREDLLPVKMAQGHDWPDTEILRANGFNVTGVAEYESLFSMLAANRYDAFPRSVVEIWAEQAHHRELKLVVEPHWVLHYPTAFYYFVNRDNPTLAETIREGLERAIADGSFEQLFRVQHAELIRQTQFAARHIIELNNPLLPPETPLSRKELWFDPRRP